MMTPTKQYVEACQECSRLCLTTVRYAQAKGDPLAEMKHLRLLLDCAELAQTAADFRPCASSLHLTICNACAVVCLKCAADCEEFADDELLQACAAACRRCAAACQALVASVTEQPEVYLLEAPVAARKLVAS